MTSFEVVAQLRRFSHERRVGHAGTLDPQASGVLPICLGGATRVVEFMLSSHKTYRAAIELGITTDTYDAAGRIVRRQDPSPITLEMVKRVLPAFRGRVWQSPPPHSALKHQGRRLYHLARAGTPIQPPPRPVEIYDLKVVCWHPPVVTLEAECGRGTYLRSLAHDLGGALGCGGHLKDLVRLSYGPFSLEDALSLPQIEAAFREGREGELLRPLDSVLADWRALTLDREGEQRVSQGQALDLGQEQRGHPGEYRRAYTLDGHFIAVLCFHGEKGVWQPRKVFSPRGKGGPK
jgi:tRNA pseudouridine55 synthase